MGRVLSLYLLQGFYARLAGILLSLTALAGLFDVLARAEELMVHHTALAPVLGEYFALRWPGLVSFLLPFSVLLAGMLFMIHLIRNHEMLAICAAEMSNLHVIRLLFAGLLPLMVVHFIWANTVVPERALKLRSWESVDYRGTPDRLQIRAIPAWFAAGPDLVHIAGLAEDGRTLEKLTVLRRDARHKLTGYATAARAVPGTERNTWHLRDVKAPLEGLEPETDLLRFAIPPTQPTVPAETADEWRYQDLREDAAISPETLGPQKRTWLHWKWAQPLQSAILLLLAAPLGLLMGRQAPLLRAGTATLAAGFSFFIVSRVLLSLAETGAIPPVLSVWAPFLIYGALGAWTVIRREA